MSAVGLLTAPLAFDFVRSWPGRIDHLDWQKANALLSEMEAEGQALLEKSGVLPEQVSHQREADIRYVGQGHEIQVPLPVGQLSSDSVSTIVSLFEEAYRRLYERLSQSVPIEIINWRVTSSSLAPRVRLQVASAPIHPSNDAARLAQRAQEGCKERDEQTVAQTAQKGSRMAYFPELGGYHDIPVYNRYGLLPGTNFTGPAIVEERESTVIVGPDCRFHIDEQQNLIVEL